MRRWARTLVYAVGAFGMLNGLSGVGGSVLSVKTAEARESADSCVSFDRTEGDKELDYGVANSCEQKLACTLSWTVRCEDNHGRVTSKKSYSSQFALVANGSHSVTASAAECEQGWNIDDVRWSCDPAK